MTKLLSTRYDKSTKTVQFAAENGDILLRSGGSIAWRLNNPGNLRPPSKYITTSIGIGSTKSGNFLIFPDYDTGRAEKKALLRRKYNNESIALAIAIYAPPNENNTQAYVDWICKDTGFSRDRIISTLSDGELGQMMNAMEQYEGYDAYRETRYEKWIKTVSVTLSDGACPIPNQAVIVKTGNTKHEVTTNAFGQLPPMPFEKAGDQIEFFCPAPGAEPKKMSVITTQEKSSLHVLFRDFFVSQASTSSHFPLNPGSVSAKPPFRYKIISGDTLSKIASKFKVSIEDLRKNNNLESTRIFAGDYLYINGAKPKDSAGRVEGSGPHKQMHVQSSTTAPSLVRSRQGQGHPLAIIDTQSKQAPWMTYAIEQAKLWHGQNEKIITKTINYHKVVKDGLDSLVGDNNPWCASFVNWCLKEAGYRMTSAPASSQSFRWSKNFVKIDAPIFGAIAVYKHLVGGHVGFVYATTESGLPILLGGNQSSTINFAMQKTKELKGFYVPSAYLKFAENELKHGAALRVSTASEMNADFSIVFVRKAKNDTL